MKSRRLITAILSVLITVALSAAAKSPDTPENRQKDDFETRLKYETTYMMNKLSLRKNTTVGDKFIQIYTDYRNEMEKVFRSPELIHREIKNGKKQPLTEEQVEFNNKARLKHAENMVRIRKKYYSEFRKILSATDMDRFYSYERSMMDKARSEAHRRASKNRNSKKTCKKS